MAAIPAPASEPTEIATRSRQRLDDVIAAYLEASRRATPLDRADLEAEHPDLADELASSSPTRTTSRALTAPLRDGTTGDIPYRRAILAAQSRLAEVPRPCRFPRRSCDRSIAIRRRSRCRLAARVDGSARPLLRRLRADRGHRGGRHGRRLQGPPGQLEPHAGAQDGARRPIRDARRSCSGSGWRPRRPRISIIRTSCRSTRSASTTAIIISA